MKTGSGKKKMRLGFGLAALGISLLILGHQASKQNQAEAVAQPVSFHSIQKQNPGADVVEFFWYGCPHCAHLEESLRNQTFHEQIAGTTLADGRKAKFLRIPAVLNPEWTLHARLFFALDDLGMDSEGHMKTMELIAKNRPKDRTSVLALLTNEILPMTENISQPLLSSASQVDELMFSSTVDAQIEEARQLGEKIGLSGVPIMMVDGDKLLSLGADADYDTMGPRVLRLLQSKETQHD